MGNQTNPTEISLHEAQRKDLREITYMALDLWKDHTYNELFEEFEIILESEKETVFIARQKDTAIGFIHLSIRYDYVEGSSSSPVGYVEGIYVKPDYRKKGVARKLINTGERWVRNKGCLQMASDIEIDNDTSYQFHLKTGFKEVNRVICFIRDIEA